MSIFAKTRIWVTLVAALATSGYLWTSGFFWSGHVGESYAQTERAMPGPEVNQKKVILKKLGMA